MARVDSASKRAKMPEGDTFDGSDGRVYRRTERGIVEVDDPARHARRLLNAIEGYTIAGLRLCDPAKPEHGAVVTLTPAEAEPVVAAVHKVLQARTAK